MITSASSKTDIKAATTAELVEFYNSLAQSPVKKFADRATAEARIWKLIQSLPPEEEKPNEVKVEPKAKPVSNADGKRASYENYVIHVLTETNPKREGSLAHKKFGVLMKMNGKTIGEYRDQEGKHPELDKEKGWPSTEIRWSINLGLIKVLKAESKAA